MKHFLHAVKVQSRKDPEQNFIFLQCVYPVTLENTEGAGFVFLFFVFLPDFHIRDQNLLFWGGLLSASENGQQG